MNRRRFLQAGLGALGFPLIARAQTAMPGTDASVFGTALVQLINFHCPRCRAVNDYHPRLAATALGAGVDYRTAPVAWEGQSLWPDRIYYATRELFPDTLDFIRDALFDGVQKEGLRFEDAAQVVSYLERRQIPQKARAINPGFRLVDVLTTAESDLPLFAEVKAGRLADMSGAEEVPVFMWITGGNVVDVVSPKQAPEPIQLVNLVMQKLNPLSGKRQ